MKLRIQYNKRHNYFYIEEEITLFFSWFTIWEIKGKTGGSVAGTHFEPYKYQSTMRAKRAMCEFISADVETKKEEALQRAKLLKDFEEAGAFEITTQDFKDGKCHIKEK